MAKTWQGQTFNEDFEPIDGQGNTLGPKDWGANRAWDEANAPGGAWNFSSDVIKANPVKSDTTRKTYTDANGAPLPAPGSGAAGAAPYGTAPTGGAGSTVPSANSPAPAWMNWQPPSEYDYNTNAMGNLLGGGDPAQDMRGTGGVKSPSGPAGANAPDNGMAYTGGSSSFNEATGTYGPGGPPRGTGGVKSPAGALGGEQANPITALLGGAQTNMPQGPTRLPPEQPPRDPYAPVVDAAGNTLVSGNGRGAFAAQQAGATPPQGPGRHAPEQPPPGGWGAPGGQAGPRQPQSALEQSLYSSVTNQINGPTTVDRNDPAYKQQVDAYNATNQRAAERQRAVAAQRAAASGTLNSGGFDASVNRLTQDQGLNEQAFEAQLMDRMGTQNIDRQARAQALGAGLVGQDKSAGLTREQMALQNQQFGLGQGLTREQMAQQQQQFGATQGLTREQMAQQQSQFGTGQRNQLWMAGQGNQLARELGLGDLGIRQQGLGLQRELGLGDLDYRRDALGQNLALSQAGLNMDAMRALLQGY